MKKFLENLKPKNTFLCFTHCDENDADEKFMKEKRQSLKKFGDLEVPEENVIKFEKSKESLEEFVAKFVKGNIKIVDNTKAALQSFDDDLPVIAKDVDRVYQTNVVY